MSHLNIARFVTDNIQPGFSQLGGVWLPVPHLLAMTLIWDNWSWHSGFAGSLFSMIGYVVATLSVFKIVQYITSNFWASMIGAAAFALNLNILYLQATPLTESLYVSFFVLSALAFTAYVVKDNPKYLLLLGLFGALQVLTRYDGWFVVVCEGILIMSYEWFYKKRAFSEAAAKTTVFAFPVIFGIAIWLLWNYLIFDNIIYFATGPYSAHSQQSNLEAQSGLVTKHNILIAIKAYWYSMVGNIGILMLFVGIIGSLSYFFITKTKENLFKFLITAFLFTPIFFNILALYLGFSVITVPELGLDTANNPSAQWFNVRYGIYALPFVAVFVGVLASVHRTAAVGVVALIVIQTFVMSQHSLINVIDGTIGSSSFDNYDIGRELKNRVKDDEKILLSTSFFNSVAFVSGHPLKQFVHEGASDMWAETLDAPEKHVKWVVMANGDTGESVYNHTLKEDKKKFLKKYKQVYAGNHAFIFTLKERGDYVLGIEEKKIVFGEEDFVIKGVNSYDLAYRSEDEIRSTFDDLHMAGVNTVRFWFFGEGTKDSFQPTAGSFNEERLQNTDLIFALAKQYDMKVIPVLINNWPEYGGKEQYLRWIGKNPKGKTDAFYTDKAAKALFKNYINHVMTRQNTLTHKTYAQETAILAWDIMNEPRIDGKDKSVIKPWLGEMTTYIRTLDNVHMLTIGTERTSSNTNEGHTLLCAEPNIDICSVHVYLYDKEKLLFTSPASVKTFLTTQKGIADRAGKPLLLQEFGVSKNTKPYGKEPLETLQDISSSARNMGYSGSMVWNWSIKEDNSFGFSPKGDSRGKYNLDDLNAVIR